MRFARLTALVGVLALVLSACGSGTTEAAGSDGADEGIQVHGHWTVQIYDMDGTLDLQAEFDNGITELGRKLLRDLLSDTSDSVLSEFGPIGLYDASSPNGTPTSPCSTPYPSLSSGVLGLSVVNPLDPLFRRVDDACYLITEDFAAIDDGFGLSEVTAGEGPEYAVVLSGSVTADQDGVIDYVESLPITDAAGSIFDGQIGLELTAFTRKSVTTLDWNGDGTANDGPIPVSEGQQVQVTVEISFS